MAQQTFLGGVELLVLLALIRLGDDAYGVPIADEIAQHGKRQLSLGSIYITLDRLEKKGLAVSRLGEPSAERGGRAKKFFKVTAAGLREVRHTQRTFAALSSGVPELSGGRA